MFRLPWRYAAPEPQISGEHLGAPSASPRGLLQRDRLVERIEEGGRVVVLRAEGGAGKTTAAVSWARALDEDRTLVWVGLGEGSDAPMAFWGRVLLALGSTLPGEAGRRMLAQLDGIANVEQAVTLFISTIMQQPEPVVLVLDDLHLVSQEAQEQLLDAVRRLPDLRLLITTRAKTPFEHPLATASLDVTVIDSQQLSFTPAETAAIAKTLPWPIGRGELTALTRISRGHTLATRLALAATQSLIETGATPDHATIIEAMDTAVADLVPALPDSEEMEFALAVALCPEVDARLADELLGGEGGWRLVQRFEERGLGRTAERSGRRVFLMHALVQSALRRRALESLAPERITEIRRTALDALRVHGDPLDVMALMLATGLDEQVLPFFTAHYSRLSIFRTGEIAAMLDQLPRPRFERTPGLAITLAISLSEKERVPSPRVLEALEIAIPRIDAQAQQAEGEAAALLALARFAAMRSAKRYAEAAEAGESFLRAVDELPPESQDPRWNPAKLQTIVTHMLAGNFERASQLSTLLDGDQAAGRVMHLHSLQSFVHALLGDFDKARRHLELTGDESIPGWSGSLYAVGWHLTSALLCERDGRIERGFEYLAPLEATVATLEQWAAYLWVRGRLLLASGRPDAAGEFQLAVRRHSDRPLSESWRQRLETLREQITRTTMSEQLTEREAAVLIELDTGRTISEIAKQLHVSTNTLKTQTRSIYRKLGVAGRGDAVQRARELGLLA